MEVQPISFMSSSISARMSPSARSTPGWPAAAKGKSINRAHSHGLDAKAERVEHMGPALNSAVHEDVDFIAEGVNDYGQLIKGTA